MEENNTEKTVEMAGKLIDLKMETEELIKSDQEVREGCKELISECNKVLNS